MSLSRPPPWTFRILMRGNAFRGMVAATLLSLSGMPLSAQEPTPASSERAAAEVGGDRQLERRLQLLEETNRLLLEQYQILRQRERENRQVADSRYQELQQRYEDVLQRLEAVGRPGPPPPVLLEGDRFGEGVMENERKPESPAAFEDATPTRDPWADEYPLTTRFADGFEFSSLDEELTLRFHVLDQTDFRNFMPNDQFPARSGLYIPRVRVYFEGELTRKFEYEVSLQRSVEGVWDLLDGNLNMVASEGFQIQFGRMLVPYSYDWFDHLEQYFITPERGLFPLNFGLSRSAGLMAQGYLGDGRVQYAVGGFDGRLAGLADNNNIRDAVGYLNARPFLHSERFPGLRFLNLGGSLFGGRQILPDEGGSLPLRTSLQSSENDEAARAASAVFLEFEKDVYSLGNRAAGALHLAWYYKQLSLEAEWQSGRFDYAKRGRPGRTGVPVSGYHVSLGYFLTGEEVEGRTTVIPLRPLELHRGRRGFGAVEAFARYSAIDLGEEVFTAELANPEEWTRRVSMVDVGFNWYLNRFVKFYVDWQLPYYATPVLVNPLNDRYSRQSPMFWVRCQIWF